MLKLDNITIGYNNKVLSDISCNCDFEFIAIIGANGSGKTTLLKTISGVIPALEGKIEINNKEITTMSANERAHYLANIFTNQPINDLLTVSDILMFGRIPYLNLGGKIKPEDETIIKIYVDEFGLHSLLSKQFHQLSDGEKQQVMIARALIQKTPIVLLDEPTAHLDIVNKRKVFESLKNIRDKEGKLLIVITHDLDLAMEYSDSIWLIDKNSKFNSFPTQEVNKEELFEKLF